MFNNYALQHVPVTQIIANHQVFCVLHFKHQHNKLYFVSFFSFAWSSIYNPINRHLLNWCPFAELVLTIQKLGFFATVFKSLIIDDLEETPPSVSVIASVLFSSRFQTEAWKTTVHITPIPLTTQEAIWNNGFEGG